MRQLGQLETVVMQRLWALDRPVSVRDVLEDLRQERDIAYTTVMTVLDNLHGKGLLARSKQGRAFLYSPVLTREEHTAGLLGQVLAQSADRGTTLLHFIGHMSETDLAGLRSALDKLEPSDANNTTP